VAGLPPVFGLLPALGLLVGEAELAALSVLDLLSDDVAGLDSALPPSPFDADSFDVDSFDVDSFDVNSFEVDSLAFLRDSDG
jgi:hypothetical protein